MKKIVIFGNSGSGKSTLAKSLKDNEHLPHLDLDTIAWLPTSPPERMPIDESSVEIERFIKSNPQWVIEGCYSDLLALALPQASEIVYLNLPIEDCIANAKNRPWEPHKYESKEAQDSNLEMLVSWIADYPNRDDTFSQTSHEALYRGFNGKKTLCRSNESASSVRLAKSDY